MPLTPEELDRLEREDERRRAADESLSGSPWRRPSIRIPADPNSPLARALEGLRRVVKPHETPENAPRPLAPIERPEDLYETPQQREERLKAEAHHILARYAEDAKRPAKETWPDASPQLERALWEKDGLSVAERRRLQPGVDTSDNQD